MTWRSIDAFRMVTFDPDRLTRFYGAIGFTIGQSRPIESDEMAILGLVGRGRRIPLALGVCRLELDWFEVPGCPYPSEANAADTVFQHFALVTGDAVADWARILAAGASPISRSGPVALPKAAGGVTAIKFRDPDGHPLELLQFLGDDPAPGISRIDHSAISVANVDASIAFYTAQGLRLGNRTLNRGEEQVALDALDDVEVDVVPLLPDVETPHLELLAYRNPGGRAPKRVTANDVAATRMVWAADFDALVRDPDGHLHQLRCRARPARFPTGCAE